MKGIKTGYLLIWIAILIFAAANSIVSMLVDIGAANKIDGRNPVSLCNILFVGNLCACLGLGVIYRHTWTRENLSKMNAKDWGMLILISLLSSALAPALIFTAIEHTTVTNVVLVGRIEPPIFLILSFLFIRERIDIWTIVGNCFALIGVGTILLIEGNGQIEIGKGELFAASGAIAYAVSTIFSKRGLQRIPLGIFSVFRTGLGALIFFLMASYLYGLEHFQDAFSPLLWKLMLVYGGIVVIGGQLCWFKGIQTSSAGEVSLASSFTPIAGVLFAFLLLGEEPGMAQYIGGAIIVLGIALSQVGGMLKRRDQEQQQESETNRLIEGEEDTGFQGI
jgi:drug/metabolite transporter (DMT)-like permease